MDSRVQDTRRWTDKFLTIGRRENDITDMSQQQHGDLRITGNVYRKVAGKYFSDARFNDTFEIIAAFIMFIYKRGLLVRTVNEDDIFDYFIWLSRKNCPPEKLRTTAASITDLFHVLLQEGTVQHNPLFKVYRLFLEGPKIFEASKKDSVLQKFIVDYKQSRPATLVVPSPSSPMPSSPSYPPPSNPIRKRGNNTLFMVSVAILLGSLLSIGFNYFNNQQSVTEVKEVLPSLLTVQTVVKKDDTRNNQEKNDRILAYFYKNDMGHYYCRDYLKISCNNMPLLSNPVPGDLESIYDGGKQYLDYCARCHGDTGRGNGPDALHLDVPMKKLGWVGNKILEKDAYLFWIIAEGGEGYGGGMPPFKGILKEIEIWKIILFLSTLR